MVSLSLVASSTAAVAASAPPPASNGWLTLSMLTPSGSAVLGSAGVAAAQPEATPPASPPGQSGIGTPPIPVILIWLAVLGVDIYIATKNNHHHPIPNSPA
jgi:hypothetical protein